ncbi:MAG: hypothetical protein EBT05_10860 [Betaproteobacteria bacterium]|nr:hypothetical protein [Betaproteobacteria bacterium]
MKRYFKFLPAALLATMLGTTAHAGGVSDKEIVLGTHLDLSGPVAAGMPHLRNGMQMRIDEVNEAGGINGRKLRIVVEDNGSQPQLAVRAVDKLIRSDDVFAIVNPFGSGPNAAAVKKSVDAGVLYFSPWAASSVIQQISGNSPLLFTTTPNYNTVMHKGVDWMVKKYGSKKVGYIYRRLQSGRHRLLLPGGTHEGRWHGSDRDRHRHPRNRGHHVGSEEAGLERRQGLDRQPWPHRHCSTTGQRHRGGPVRRWRMESRYRGTRGQGLERQLQEAFQQHGTR